MPKKKYEIDMVNGALLPKIFRFSLPLMLSGILQFFFNAADIIVVGRFTGKEALAAVGSTSSLTNLLITIFVGLSVGTNVLVAKYIGAKDDKKVSEAVHTSILISFICGAVMILVGLFFTKPLLTLMGTPSDVLNQAALYMRIYFLSMPAVMLYNFGSAVLRAVGDTKRPLYYLTISGIINVICNLFFVIVLHWGVAGVAIATAISQIISASLVLVCLMKTHGIYKVQWKKLKIHRDMLIDIIKIGLPAGIQGIVFSISNVLIQSSINSFGSIAMAGNAAASSLEGFIWISMNAYYQANLSFTSQNIGAKKYSRIKRITIISVGIVAVIGVILGISSNAFGRELLGIYNSNPDVIAFGLNRLKFVGLLSFIGGSADTLGGSMRGLGYSILPTVIALSANCVFRIIWVLTIFKMNPTPDVLFFSYPVSWVLALLCYLVSFIIALHKLPKNDGE